MPDFDFFAVPGTDPAIKFDVFPGAPAVTDGATVVFKGNFTEDGVGKTGVYYRDLDERADHAARRYRARAGRRHGPGGPHRRHHHD